MRTLKTLLLVSILTSLATAQGIGGKAGVGGKAGFGGGPVTGPSWVFKQAACSGQTGCSVGAIANTATTQTATFSASLTAGDTLAINVIGAGATAPSGVSCVSVACTIVGPDANCSRNDVSANGVAANCYYVASVTGGQTGVTVTFASSTLYYIIALVAHKSGGSPSFDTSNSLLYASSCTSCTGSALTLTGSNDAVFRWNFQGGGGPSAITGGFTFGNPNSTDFPNGSAYIVGTGSGTAPTYTYPVSDTGNEEALAFK